MRNLFIHLRKQLAFALILVLSSSFAFSQRQVPEHGGIWVRDEANVLSPGAVSELNTILKAHRDSTSDQIAVYIIPSLDGDDIDDYSNRVFKEWKLGQADKDNGVLFLISIGDKVMRIEVGQGLEGVLTDAQSSRINRNQVAPHFRVGDYDGGVIQGVGAIMQTIAGTYVNEEPPQQQQQRRSGKRSPLSYIIIIIFILIAAFRRKGGGGGGGGYVARGLLGGMMMGGGFGRSSGSWGGGGGDFGGGGFSGGGGSSDSW